jgi:hypothetical protein
LNWKKSKEDNFMNQVRKYFPIFVTVLSIVMLFGGTSFAQNTQTVTLVPSAASVEPGGSLSLAVNYNCTKKVSNFSVEIYYDDTKFTFVDAVANYTVGALGAPQHDETGNKIVISYLDIMGSWPAADLPLDDVVTLNFTANAGASGAGEFTIVDKAELPQVDFVGNPVSVGVGSGPVLYALTTGVTGTGAGTITRTPDAAEYEAGAVVTLEAVVTSGEFESWSNGATDNPTTITMTAAPMTVNATINLAANVCQACIDPQPNNTIYLKEESTWTSTCTTVADGDTITKWNWRFTDDNGSIWNTTGSDITATTTKPGLNYEHPNSTAILKIETQMGCTSEVEYSFAIIEQPSCNGSASFTASANGLTVTFNHAASTGNLMYNYGDGNTEAATSGEPTNVHTYAADGTYTVILTATDTVTNEVCDTEQTVVTVSGGGDPCAGYMAGDYDRDGVIDIFDALGVAMYTVNLVTITDNCLLDALDVDGNGSVNIDDALAIARHDVGLVCNCSLDSLR